VGPAICAAATWIHCLQRPRVLISWQSRTWLGWNDKPKKSVTLRYPSTFPAPSDLLGCVLGSVLRVPLGRKDNIKIDLRDVWWGTLTVSMRFRTGQVAGSCEYGDKSLGFIECGEFLD
jgi:hypothetical protein